MKKPDAKVIQALVNLESSRDFKVIQEWMLNSLAIQDNVLRSAEAAPVLYRAQGAVNELMEFCDYAATPKEFAKKLAIPRPVV